AAAFSALSDASSVSEFVLSSAVLSLEGFLKPFLAGLPSVSSSDRRAIAAVGLPLLSPSIAVSLVLAAVVTGGCIFPSLIVGTTSFSRPFLSPFFSPAADPSVFFAPSPFVRLFSTRCPPVEEDCGVVSGVSLADSPCDKFNKTRCLF
ncbi:hypothetical protein TcCL_NonESM11322, partial [Trypanosoma cruzi]